MVQTTATSDVLTTGGNSGAFATRALTVDDLRAVIAIDSKHSGSWRQGFYEQRLAAALSKPKDFIYVGTDVGGTLAGFVFAHLLEGEFGGTAPVAVLDAIGVDPERHGHGVGRALMAELETVMRKKGVRELQTQIDWRNHRLMRFLDFAGFRRAPRLVLESEPGRAQSKSEDTAMTDPMIPPHSDEVDYSMPMEDPGAVLVRDQTPIRSMREDDLPALVDIDRRITGRDRSPYYQRKLAEALEEVGIRVSLIAERDGLAVGFIMANVDFGEFGQVEPEAIIHTIVVHPDMAHENIASALMSQLLANLGSLRIERVYTEVNWSNAALLGFLDHCGFHPSQRLAFSRSLD